MAGCASVNSARKCASINQDYIDHRGFEVNDCPRGPRVERPTLRELINLPAPRQKAVVSVYSFNDLTGQRATADNGRTWGFRCPHQRATTYYFNAQ